MKGKNGNNKKGYSSSNEWWWKEEEVGGGGDGGDDGVDSESPFSLEGHADGFNGVSRRREEKRRKGRGRVRVFAFWGGGSLVQCVYF